MKSSLANQVWLYPLTGILLFAAWPNSSFTFLLLFAFVPLLWLERRIISDGRFFWLVWLNMFIWNISTTWWIWNASPPGAAGAIIANSLLMCFPLMAFRFTRRHAGDAIGYLSLILYWITFEYIHHNWELSWPWLTLGNALANATTFIQWYEYTGTTGGTLWILLLNMAVAYPLFKLPHYQKKLVFYLRLLVIFGPMMASSLMKPSDDVEDNTPTAPNVVVVQPNVEPYTEKFTTPPGQLLQELIDLSKANIDSNTRLLVWPETAIPAQAWEHKLQEETLFQPLYAFARQHPQLLIVTGIDSYKFYGNTNPDKFSARQMSDGSYYEAFNTAMALQGNTAPQLYHKSKLVPGVEGLPSWLGFMGKLFDDFGGISGSLGKSDSAIAFGGSNNPYVAAPIICYESIYSNYVTDYVRAGANVLTVITNDGWWGNTPGYKQHMSMSRLRAIENRMWVARSANTGISCFISPSGEVLQAQPWDKQAVIKRSIVPNNEATFYASHGDWMSRLAWPLAVALFLWVCYKRWKNRHNH